MTSPARRFTRARNGKVLAGVCAGIANYFGKSPWLIRALFLLSCILPGPQFVVYLLLWIVIPKD